MNQVAELFTMFRQNKRLKLIALGIVSIATILLVIIPFGLSFTPENIRKSEIKDRISQKIGRGDFEVKEIVKESQGWYLARIGFKKEKYENTSLAILRLEGGRFVLKFGPGTSFNNELLDAVGVPKDLYDRQGKVALDPITELLPYDTDYYTVRTSAPPSAKLSNDENHNHASAVEDTDLPTIGTPENPKELTVYAYEFPRTGEKVTPEKIARYTTEVKSWIQSQGLSTDNYTLTFAIWPYGDY